MYLSLLFSRWGSHHLFLNLLQGFCNLMNYPRLCTWGAWSLKQLSKPPKRSKLCQNTTIGLRWLQDGHGVFKHPSMLDDRLELVWITSLRAHWNMWFISDPRQQAMWFHKQFIEFLFGRPPPSTSGKWRIIGIPYKNESPLVVTATAKGGTPRYLFEAFLLLIFVLSSFRPKAWPSEMYHWKHLIHHGFKQIQLLPSLNQAWTGSTCGPDQMKGWKAFPFLSANNSSKFSASGSEEIQEKNNKTQWGREGGKRENNYVKASYRSLVLNETGFSGGMGAPERDMHI